MALTQFFKYLSIVLIFVISIVVTYEVGRPSQHKNLWTQYKHDPFKQNGRNLASSQESFLKDNFDVLKDFFILSDYFKSIKWVFKFDVYTKNKQLEFDLKNSLQLLHEKLSTIIVKDHQVKLNLIEQNLWQDIEKLMISTQKKYYQSHFKVLLSIYPEQDSIYLNTLNNVAINLKDKGNLASLVFDKEQSFIDKLKNSNIPYKKTPFQFIGGQIMLTSKIKSPQVKINFRRFYRINDADSMPLNFKDSNYKYTQTSFNFPSIYSEQYLTIDLNGQSDRNNFDQFNFEKIIFYPGQILSLDNIENKYKSGNFYLHGNILNKKNKRFRLKIDHFSYNIGNENFDLISSTKRSYPNSELKNIENQVESKFSKIFLKQLRFHNFDKRIKGLDAI